MGSSFQRTFDYIFAVISLDEAIPICVILNTPPTQPPNREGPKRSTSVLTGREIRGDISARKTSPPPQFSEKGHYMRRRRPGCIGTSASVLPSLLECLVKLESPIFHRICKKCAEVHPLYYFQSTAQQQQKRPKRKSRPGLVPGKLMVSLEFSFPCGTHTFTRLTTKRRRGQTWAYFSPPPLVVGLLRSCTALHSTIFKS